MQDTAAFWDKTAEKYAQSPIRDMAAYEYTLERTRHYLSKSDRVLEVGCGTGSTALLLAGDVRHITASDISGEMIRIASAKARDGQVENVDFVVADILDDTLCQGPFDAVLAHNLLHLLPDLGAALQRIGTLLKPDGLFISKTICTPGKGAPIKFRLMKAALPLLQVLGKAPYVNFMESEKLEAALSSAGFRAIETGNHPAQPPCRYIVARKGGERVSAD